MLISINGREQDVRLSHDEIVERAGKDPSVGYSVIWQSGGGLLSGSVAPGESVELYEGMAFTVAVAVAPSLSERLDTPEQLGGGPASALASALAGNDPNELGDEEEPTVPDLPSNIT